MFDRFGHQISAQDHVDADADAQDVDVTPHSMLELLEGGIDMVENAPRENAISRELARCRGAVSAANRAPPWASLQIILHIWGACRAFFATIVGGESLKAAPRMNVEQIISLRDGRTVFLGEVEGANQFIGPSLWWLTMGCRPSSLVQVDGEVTPRHQSRRALVTRDAIDLGLVGGHVGSISLIEFRGR
jgi:hypothetical protein